MGVIPRSLVVMSIVLSWILKYRNWPIHNSETMMVAESLVDQNLYGRLGKLYWNSVWSRSRECVKNATSVFFLSSISQLAEIWFWKYKVSTIFRVFLNLPYTVYYKLRHFYGLYAIRYTIIKVPVHEGHDASTCRSGMLQWQYHALFTHRGHVCVYAMWLYRYYLCPSYTSLLHVTCLWKDMILSVQHVAGTFPCVMTPRVREA